MTRKITRAIRPEGGTTNRTNHTKGPEAANTFGRWHQRPNATTRSVCPRYTPAAVGARVLTRPWSNANTERGRMGTCAPTRGRDARAPMQACFRTRSVSARLCGLRARRVWKRTLTALSRRTRGTASSNAGGRETSRRSRRRRGCRPPRTLRHAGVGPRQHPEIHPALS